MSADIEKAPRLLKAAHDQQVAMPYGLVVVHLENACNSHDALVEAIEHTLSKINPDHPMTASEVILRNALAQAKVGA